MSNGKFLLVEGYDDQHVVWALLKHFNVLQNFVVDEKKGIENVFKTFPVLLKGSEIDAVAIVIDADIDAQARWMKFRSAIEKLGYINCPGAPPAGGLILEQVGLPKIGAWIMPDNSLPGMLEDFIGYLVPEGDILWSYTIKTLDEMPTGIAEFKNIHLSKARIHTWLSWKEDPGTPMGLAITKKWLNPEADSAKPFVDWINRMFA